MCSVAPLPGPRPPWALLHGGQHYLWDHLALECLSAVGPRGSPQPRPQLEPHPPPTGTPAWPAETCPLRTGQSALNCASVRPHRPLFPLRVMQRSLGLDFSGFSVVVVLWFSFSVQRSAEKLLSSTALFIGTKASVMRTSLKRHPRTLGRRLD